MLFVCLTSNLKSELSWIEYCSSTDTTTNVDGLSCSKALSDLSPPITAFYVCIHCLLLSKIYLHLVSLKS